MADPSCYSLEEGLLAWVWTQYHWWGVTWLHSKIQETRSSEVGDNAMAGDDLDHALHCTYLMRIAALLTFHIACQHLRIILECLLLVICQTALEFSITFNLHCTEMVKIQNTHDGSRRRKTLNFNLVLLYKYN